MTDWLLTFGYADEPSLTRALEGWKEHQSPHWLVASLWGLRAPSPAADAVLDAAARVDRRSPAFPTVAFLRVRALARKGPTC